MARRLARLPEIIFDPAIIFSAERYKGIACIRKCEWTAYACWSHGTKGAGSAECGPPRGLRTALFRILDDAIVIAENIAAKKEAGLKGLKLWNV